MSIYNWSLFLKSRCAGLVDRRACSFLIEEEKVMNAWNLFLVFSFIGGVCGMALFVLGLMFLLASAIIKIRKRHPGGLPAIGVTLLALSMILGGCYWYGESAVSTAKQEALEVEAEDPHKAIALLSKSDNLPTLAELGDRYMKEERYELGREAYFALGRNYGVPRLRQRAKEHADAGKYKIAYELLLAAAELREIDPMHGKR